MITLLPQLERAADLLKILSHPVRLRIACALVEGPQSVYELTQDCGLSQPAMSQHLAKLRNASVVTTRREAQTIYYSLASHEVETLLHTLHQLYCPKPA